MKFRYRALKFAAAWPCAFLLLIAASAVAAPDGAGAPDEDVPLPVPSHFTRRTLENGLIYYVSRNAEPEKRARLLLVVHAGTALEESNPRQTCSLTVSFSCGPDKVEPLTAAVFARIAELKEGKTLARYLDPVVKSQRAAHQQQLKLNGYWHWLLSYAYRNGIPAEEYRFADELLARVSADSVMAAARRHLDLANSVNIVHYSGD
jgi:hypothetical protein